MIRLTIKGNKKNATRAASRRNIPVRGCVVHEGETFCDAPCSKEAAIGRWFAERGGTKRGRGYTPGTLLFYSMRDCSRS